MKVGRSELLWMASSRRKSDKDKEKKERGKGDKEKDKKRLRRSKREERRELKGEKEVGVMIRNKKSDLIGKWIG